MLTLAADAPIAAQSVRCALLVTDLVDSTQLFTRLGEYAATQLLGSEEDCARRLARQFNAHEIDRSDGFLLLFEHAWQAVAFAIAYHHELDALSRRCGVRLRAKIGIHWCDVYLSRHAAEDVAQGAKPLEASGVGKAIAARLMSAAHPGQVLLSAAAREAAERECTSRSDCGALKWVNHGRYRLKGVDLPLELHEVYPRGTALPREPLENGKVVSLRREMRRRLLKGGGALAAGVGLPALGLSLYQQRRFDFPKSGWLVLADWLDPSGNGELTRVLGVAFRIALEQSRFAFVLNDEAVRETLRRMRSDVGALTDRSIAIEVAQREQARALVMPAITTLGTGLRLSAAVIDPWKKRLVFSVDVAAPSTETLTRALDDLAASVRSSLGESMEAIVADSRPLARVTTGDMGALRLFTEAEYKVRERKPAEAIALLQQAIDIDPDFASAYAKLGTIQMLFRIDQGAADASWRAAIARAERLTRREQMYVEATLSNTTTPELMLTRWSAMYTVFPDDMPAGNNVAWLLWSHFGRVEDALKLQDDVVKLSHPWRARALHNLGYLHLAQGNFAAASDSFHKALDLDDDPVHWGLVRFYLASGNVTAAEELLNRFARDALSPALETERTEASILHAVYLGDFDRALAAARTLYRRGDIWGLSSARLVALRCQLHLGCASGQLQTAYSAHAELLSLVREQYAADIGGAMIIPRADAFMLALVAVREGWAEHRLATEELVNLNGRWGSYPQLHALHRLLQGWEALQANDAEGAIQAAIEARSILPLFLIHELELAARQALGEKTNNMAEALTLRLHEALSEPYNYFSLQLPNLLAWRQLRRQLQ